MMSLSEFLKDLPTHNRDNFTRLQTDASGVGRPHHGQVTTRTRSTVYVPTKDIPSEQIIVTEKTNILLRYLHQQWDKKAAQAANAQRKREAEGRVHEDEQSAGPSGTGASARKKARLDPLPNGSNTGGANGAANPSSGALLDSHIAPYAVGNSSGLTNPGPDISLAASGGSGTVSSSAAPYIHHNYHNSHPNSHHQQVLPQNSQGNSGNQPGSSAGSSSSAFLQ